jgi:hypothetical protein
MEVGKQDSKAKKIKGHFLIVGFSFLLVYSHVIRSSIILSYVSLKIA